jgi:hypothetical protein
MAGGRLSSWSELRSDAFAVSSIWTRTEMTAGFTLATRSAKPAGCWWVAGCWVSAARAPDIHDGDKRVYPIGPPNATIAPMPATEASSTRRRRETIREYR